MLEETNQIKQMSAREKACLRQCRLARFLSGGTIFDGNCTCDLPSDCRFQIKSELDEDNTMFADRKFYYNQMWSE